MNLRIFKIGLKKLLEEFKSLGFFISDHPLTDYEDFFKELNIVSYKDFLINKKNESQVAGTLMSIQEKKKTQKGNTLRDWKI